MSWMGNSTISFIGRIWLSGYGSTLYSSAVRQFLTSAGQGEMSNFNVPASKCRQRPLQLQQSISISLCCKCCRRHCLQPADCQAYGPNQISFKPVNGGKALMKFKGGLMEMGGLNQLTLQSITLVLTTCQIISLPHTLCVRCPSYCYCCG